MPHQHLIPNTSAPIFFAICLCISGCNDPIETGQEKPFYKTLVIKPETKNDPQLQDVKYTSPNQVQSKHDFRHQRLLLSEMLESLNPETHHEKIKAAAKFAELVGGHIELYPDGPNQGEIHLFDLNYSKILNFESNQATRVKAQLTRLFLQLIEGSRFIKFIDLSNTGVSDDDLLLMSKNTQLLALNLDENPISDKGLGHLVHFKQLKILRLAHTHINGRGLNDISNLPELEWLDLAGNKLQSVSIPVLKEFNQLEILSLAETPFADIDAETLIGISSLKSLDLCGTHVGALTISSITSLRSLRELDISRTKVSRHSNSVKEFKKSHPNCRIIDSLMSSDSNDPMLQRASVTRIKQLGGKVTYVDGDDCDKRSFFRIQSINLSETSVNDRDVCQFANLTAVRSISLARTPVTNGVCVYLADFRNLRLVNLAYTKVYNTGFDYLRIHCSMLECVDLSNTGVDFIDSPAHLSNIKTIGKQEYHNRLNAIKHLEKAGCRLTYAKPGKRFDGFPVSEKGKTAQKLSRSFRPTIPVAVNFSGTDVTIESIEHLRHLPHLRTLYFNNSNCSDIHIEFLATKLDSNLDNSWDLPFISNVYLWFTSVSDRGLQKLRDALPNVVISATGSHRTVIQKTRIKAP